MAVSSTITGGISEAISDTRSWIEAPFTEPLSISQLFLITGVVIVSAVLWLRILSHLNTEL